MAGPCPPAVGKPATVLAPAPKGSLWVPNLRGRGRGRQKGQRTRRNFTYPKLDVEKGRASLTPLPTLEGTRRTGQGVIGWTRGLHLGWHDLPIENIIAFDFSKYQG